MWLQEYQNKAPFTPSLLVEFRKRLTDDILTEINEMIVRLERISFDAYNEGDVQIGTIEGYHDRIGHYPERVLVYQIYRNRKNRAYCKEHGIRISGSALGRPKHMTYDEKKLSYIDNTDRIEVERGFCLAKRYYGMGLIRTRLDTTTRSSIALSILAMNINHLVAVQFLQYLVP